MTFISVQEEPFYMENRSLCRLFDYTTYTNEGLHSFAVYIYDIFLTDAKKDCFVTVLCMYMYECSKILIIEKYEVTFAHFDSGVPQLTTSRS